jgi:hypothetical protein
LKFIFYFTFLSFLIYFIFGGGFGSCSHSLPSMHFYTFSFFLFDTCSCFIPCLEYLISYEYKTLASKCSCLHSAFLSQDQLENNFFGVFRNMWPTHLL